MPKRIYAEKVINTFLGFYRATELNEDNTEKKNAFLKEPACDFLVELSSFSHCCFHANIMLRYVLLERSIQFIMW